LRSNLPFVIPGWSEGPDPESRDSGFALRAPRNDVVIERIGRYLFDLRFFAVFRFFAPLFAGTLLPSALASERPIAIACLRLLTLRPERPLLSVPALRFFIARPTLADAFLEYFRAMNFLPVTGKIIFVAKVGSLLDSLPPTLVQAIAE
jgi:hypothetical protein